MTPERPQSQIEKVSRSPTPIDNPNYPLLPTPPTVPRTRIKQSFSIPEKGPNWKGNTAPLEQPFSRADSPTNTGLVDEDRSTGQDKSNNKDSDSDKDEEDEENRASDDEEKNYDEENDDEEENAGVDEDNVYDLDRDMDGEDTDISEEHYTDVPDSNSESSDINSGDDGEKIQENDGDEEKRSANVYELDSDTDKDKENDVDKSNADKEDNIDKESVYEPDNDTDEPQDDTENDDEGNDLADLEESAHQLDRGTDDDNKVNLQRKARKSVEHENTQVLAVTSARMPVWNVSLVTGIHKKWRTHPKSFQGR